MDVIKTDFGTIFFDSDIKLHPTDEKKLLADAASFMQHLWEDDIDSILIKRSTFKLA